MKKQFLLFFLLISTLNFSQNLPKGFVYLKDVAPTIQNELRYCSHNNFIGVPIDGYEESTVIITTPAAIALKKVQAQVQKQKYSLKVFDAYRPQQAVNHFVRWARVYNDTIKKQEYYPKVNKRHLFKLGYITSKSGHSRGSTVDLTLVDLKTGKEVDMGSKFDFFGEKSHLYNKTITPTQQKNRNILRKAMVKNGFRPYKNEWWHYTLRNEPYPKTYFNFPVK